MACKAHLTEEELQSLLMQVKRLQYGLQQQAAQMTSSLAAWQAVELEHAASIASLRKALKVSSQELQAAQAASLQESGRTKALEQQVLAVQPCDLRCGLCLQSQQVHAALCSCVTQASFASIAHHHDAWEACSTSKAGSLRCLPAAAGGAPGG